MSKILLVEDEESIRGFIKINLIRNGFEVIEAGSGEAGINKALNEKPDMAILDVMLPGIDGFQVCSILRNEYPKIGIIMLTAKGQDMDKIMGLEYGADDYIVKPFSPNEVMARLRAVLRRLQKPEDMINNENIIHISNMTVNLEEYTFKVNGERIPLTKKEIETMWTLASNPNKVFTRDNLLDSLWGYDYYGDSRTVDSHIKRLRAKLDSVEHPDWTIKTIWGVGYKFEISEENF